MTYQFEEKEITCKPLEDVFFLNKSLIKKKPPFHKRAYKATNTTLAVIISIMAFADIVFGIDLVEYLMDYSGILLGVSSILILQGLQYIKSFEILPEDNLITPLTKKQKTKEYLNKNKNLIQAVIFTMLFLLFIIMPSFLTVA